MHRTLCALQIILGVYFVGVGITHFIVPEGLTAAIRWMYDLSPTLHYLAGTAEMLGGLGLILPGLTRVQIRLIPLAAAGLVLVMVGAAIWHLPRGETQNMAMTVLLAALLAFVGYGRWRLRPLAGCGARLSPTAQPRPTRGYGGGTGLPPRGAASRSSRTARGPRWCDPTSR